MVFGASRVSVLEPSAPPINSIRSLCPLQMCQRVLPSYVQGDPWQAKWEADTISDVLHDICLALFDESTSEARRCALRKELKALTERHSIWEFEGHVQTYGIGRVGSIGELAVPDFAQGHFLRYRENRLRIVQHGSGRYGRQFSLLRVAPIVE